MANSGIRLLLTSAWYLPVLAAADLPAGCRVVDLEADGDFQAAGAAVTDDEVREQTALVRGSDGVRVIYTSGTTSKLKACLHTHDALVAQGDSVAAALGLPAGDRFWTPLEMFHTGGWTPFLAAQARGAALHHGDRFDAGPALSQIVDQRCTVLFPGFETVWMDVLGQPGFSADRLAARLVIIVGVPKRLRIMQDQHLFVPRPA